MRCRYCRSLVDDEYGEGGDGGCAYCRLSSLWVNRVEIGNYTYLKKVLHSSYLATRMSDRDDRDCKLPSATALDVHLREETTNRLTTNGPLRNSKFDQL